MEPVLQQKLSPGLKNVVNDATRNTEMERDLKTGWDDLEYSDLEKSYDPVIKVVGVGGAGNNTVNRLYNIRLDEAEIIGINTDKQHLDVIKADKKILIGKSLTRGLGAGGHPETGRRAAELGRSTLQEVLNDSDVVFITAGMGGGTGSGAAPLVAEIASEQGALVVGLVSTPFKVEQAHMISAEPHLSNLRKVSDVVLPMDLQLLLKYIPNLPLEQAYSVMDQLIAQTVKDISRSLIIPGLINLDLADFEDIVREGGDAALLLGECPVQDGSEKLVDIVLSHPLSKVDYQSAKRALIQVTGGPEMTVDDAENILQSFVRKLGPDLKVAWGATRDKDYEGKARAIVILTGIEKVPLKELEAGRNRSSRKLPFSTIVDEVCREPELLVATGKSEKSPIGDPR